LPTLGIAVGQGVHAIATNKIVGCAGALMALMVYLRRIKLPWGKTAGFSFWIMLGSFGGSQVSPHLPKELFQWFLLLSYPVILWTVWKKDLWIQEAATPAPHKGGSSAWALGGATHPRIVTAGLACGFYDGMWGPGGGTFMLLALLLVARMPLLVAVAASKFANTVSAGTALVGYSIHGLVHVKEGVIMALGMCVGAYCGASLASKKAAVIVRPLLAVISTVLVLKNLLGF
jgi:uncharacterized membrane protein YfcA